VSEGMQYALLSRTYSPCEEQSAEIAGSALRDGVFFLPGAARYNAHYGHTALFCDGIPLEYGTGWVELNRPRGSAPDDSTLYWSHRVLVREPKAGAAYRLHWRNPAINATVPGLREARVWAGGAEVFAGKSTLRGGQWPNGIAWDKGAFPDGYKIEIWRKTKHKQEGYGGMPKHRGARWMLWRAVPADHGGICLTSAIQGRNTGTAAFRFAFLAPDGARGLLSPEVAVYHGGKAGWGNGIGHGRVRLK